MSEQPPETLWQAIKPVLWHGYAAILWLALIIMPTVWFDLPVWASMLLAAFWYWQIKKHFPLPPL